MPYMKRHECIAAICLTTPMIGCPLASFEATCHVQVEQACTHVFQLEMLVLLSAIFLGPQREFKSNVDE